MIAKVKMPRFRLLLKKDSMFKELMMTFIGTTLSIILTFGTAHYVDQRNARAIGRQTAMMVIHDMDNSTQLLKDMAKNEDTYNQMARYLIENLDVVDSLAEDTLWKIVNYITADTEEEKPYQYDDSSEKVFLSSQESWKNIDNAVFIDAVHDFYSTRQDYYDYINHSPYFRKPVSSEAIYKYYMEHADESLKYQDIIKTFVKSKEVIFYLDNAIHRQELFDEMAEEFRRISDLCKFAMGITDEELEEYVRSHERSGRKVKESELTGKWIVQNTDASFYSYEFFEDHTLRRTNKDLYPYTIYTGRIVISYICTGTWEVSDDSLVMILNPNYEYKVDTTQIKPKPGKEKDVDDYIKEIENACEEGKKETLSQKEEIRKSYFASINPSGNKIELQKEDEDKSGKKNNITFFLTRQEE